MSDSSSVPGAERLTPEIVGMFRRTIYQNYARHGRRLPWRMTRNPYDILVSEMMLQQTQVERVVAKYEQFISSFPDFQSLARASLRAILEMWQGLGYNRRALSLRKIARRVVSAHGGMLPDSAECLLTLPGIGPASAGAICAFAFNQPTVFVETNIRAVFLRFFFAEYDGVKDKDILPLVERTLDTRSPRRWYYGLMDYGAMLKKSARNPSHGSAHYQGQGQFRGSDREIRGLVLRGLLAERSLREAEIVATVGKNPERVRKIITRLVWEGFIVWNGTRLRIAS